MTEVDLRSWYWIVGGEQVWSSAAALAAGSFSAGYVAQDASDYAAFLSAGNIPTRILSEVELRDVSIAVVEGLEMLRRITPQEYAAIRTAESADSAGVGMWLDALRVNKQVNLFGYTSEAARTGMVGAGLLTPQRAAEVFAP